MVTKYQSTNQFFIHFSAESPFIFRGAGEKTPKDDAHRYIKANSIDPFKKRSHESGSVFVTQIE